MERLAQRASVRKVGGDPLREQAAQLARSTRRLHLVMRTMAQELKHLRTMRDRLEVLLLEHYEDERTPGAEVIATALQLLSGEAVPQ